MSELPSRRETRAATAAAAELRRRAEELLERLSGLTAAGPKDVASLAHELRVHQVELELQNEDLRRAQSELVEQRENYIELFDAAPVGYVALDGAGIVRSANPTAALLLNVLRQNLVGHPFGAFVLAADRPTYSLHLGLLNQSGWPQTCELRLQPGGERAGDEGAAGCFWARLEWSRRTSGVEQPRDFLTFTDVNERALAEEALRHSEAKYRDVVERASDGIAILQGDLIVFANEALARMTGFAVGELVGLPFVTVVSPDQHAMIAELVRRRLAGGDLQPAYDLDLVRKDGSSFAAEASGGVIVYEGAPADLVLIRDVTERQRAEEELRQSEDKFAKAFRASPDAIIISRLSDGCVAEVNDSFARLLGFGSEEAIGRSTVALGMWVDPADRERVVAPLRRDGVVRDVDVAMRCKSGEVLECLCAATLIEIGSEAHILTLVRDVSEWRRAAAARRESEALLCGILDNMQDAYVRTDGDGRFLMVSPSAARLYGYDSVEEMVGLPAASLYADEADREAMLDELRRSGSVGDYVGRGRRKGGSELWVSLSAHFYRDDQGNVLGCEGFVRDITERRQVEEALRASEANFRAFFETTDEMIVVATPEGRIVYANPALTAKLGYSVAEIRELHVLELNPAERRAEAEAMLAAVGRGERDTRPVPLQTSSGALIAVETHVRPGRWDGADCIFAVFKGLAGEQEAPPKLD